MTQRISLSPSNPVQGGQVTICYDFDGLGINSVQLKVTYTPGSGSTTYTVTEEEPCVTIAVPDNAISILVQDLSRNSPDKAAAVRPKQ